MKILSKREDIIIIKADKGGAVITGVGDYVKEANQQLGSTEFSKKLPNDTTELNRTNISTASIEELETLGLLDEKTTNHLKIKIQQFKMFPKIHKKENHGRPMVRYVDYHSMKISKYIDHVLQPHVKGLLGTYLTDSTKS